MLENRGRACVIDFQGSNSEDGKKVTTRYIVPYQILESIGTVSYRLNLLESMSSIHNVFHVSMLKKQLRDEEQ